jgi:hypothetical protein
MKFTAYARHSTFRSQQMRTGYRFPWDKARPTQAGHYIDSDLSGSATFGTADDLPRDLDPGAHF